MIYLILFLGFIIRLININQSLWLDEAITAQAVKTYSLANLITKFSPGDFHPPFYYLILKLWSNLFGYSEITLRLPSVIFGLAVVYFVYLIGRKLFNQKVALLASLFLAINPLAIYYSQEARMYSLAMLAVTASIYFFLEKRWLWWFFCLLVAMYSDYLPWLILPVFVLITNKKKLLISHFLLLFVAFIPWLPILWKQLSNGASVTVILPEWGNLLGGFSIKGLALVFVKFIIGRISLDNKIIYAIVITSIGAVYFWLMIRVRNRILWIWLLLPIILGLIISLKIPVFTYFRFLFVLPAFILLLAAGASRNKIFVLFVSLVSFGCLLIFNSNSSFQRDNWRDAVLYMEKNNGIALLPSLATVSPINYYRQNLPVYDPQNFPDLKPHQPVFLIRYVQEIFDPKDSLRQQLEFNGYAKTEVKNFNQLVIWRYDK